MILLSKHTIIWIFSMLSTDIVFATWRWSYLNHGSIWDQLITLYSISYLWEEELPFGPKIISPKLLYRTSFHFIFYKIEISFTKISGPLKVNFSPICGYITVQRSLSSKVVRFTILFLSRPTHTHTSHTHTLA